MPPWLSRALVLAALGLVVAVSVPAWAEAADDATSAPSPTTSSGSKGEPGTKSAQPRVDILLPDGDFDFRLGRLIKSALVEGQFRYNFARGDINAYLRYRYYGRDRTYQLSLFDTVSFEQIQKLSNDFTRVRGTSFLITWPQDFYRRLSLLTELDSINSNRLSERFTTDKSNTFVRLGYQYGTPNDERSNAIVGESRPRVQRLFTAYQEIGPQGFGLTGALTSSFEVLGSSFSYLRGELEGLKRFNFGSGRTFLIARLHGGTFFAKKVVRSGPDVAPADRYAIPIGDLFALGGADNLRGVSSGVSGTDELHATAEFFLPWFVDQDRRALWLDWHSWYWVAYAGYGAAVFSRRDLGELTNYIPDVGIGVETHFTLKQFNFFLSAIVAQPLKGSFGPKARVSIKSFR